MKILNKEAGEEILYLELKNIIEFSYIYDGIKNNMFDQILTGYYNRKYREIGAFIIIEDKTEIEYFKNFTGIIDYKEARNMSLLALEEEKHKIKLQFREIKKALRKKQLKEEASIQVATLKHKLSEYKNIEAIRKGQIKNNVPLVPDSDGLEYKEINIPYNFITSLNPNVGLIYRKDGKPLDSQEYIPSAYFSCAMAQLAYDRMENDEFIKKFESNCYLSDDKKYLITELVVEPYTISSAKQKIKTIFNHK